MVPVVLPTTYHHPGVFVVWVVVGGCRNGDLVTLMLVGVVWMSVMVGCSANWGLRGYRAVCGCRWLGQGVKAGG